MNRTSIDWAQYSWNPITGCLGPNGRGPCDYCYARRIAERFGGPDVSDPDAAADFAAVGAEVAKEAEHDR